MSDVKVSNRIYMRELPAYKKRGKFYVEDRIGRSQWPILYQDGRIGWDYPETVMHMEATKERLRALWNVVEAGPGMWYCPYPNPVVLTEQGAAWAKDIKFWKFCSKATIIEGMRVNWGGVRNTLDIQSQLHLPWLNLWEYQPFYEALDKTNEGAWDYEAEYNMAAVTGDLETVGAELLHESWARRFAGGCYWNEIYGMEPWEELGMEPWDISHALLKHHFTVFGESVIGWRLNPKSPLNDFLAHYGRMGVRTDMLINMHTVLQAVVDAAMQREERRRESMWLHWYDLVVCPKCNLSQRPEPNGRCSECNADLYAEEDEENA